MPAPIIWQDQSGLGQGISQAGGALGQALGQRMQQKRLQSEQQQYGNILQQTLGTLPPDASPMEMMQALSQATGAGVPPDMVKEYTSLYSTLQETVRKRGSEVQKGLQQKQEAEILSKFQRGEELSPQEMSLLSPTSIRTLIGLQKPQFEPTERKLEAERVSKLATEIETSFRASKNEDQRLDRMEKLNSSGKLTTPATKKILDSLGLPLGILDNPDSEEFSKLEADFLRDVRDVFPGGRITNYEIQAYLRTVPTLSNTPAGRHRVIHNRRLLNQAKKIRYDVYKEILKENKGKKPPNLGLLIEERVGPQLDAVSEEFREGVSESINEVSSGPREGESLMEFQGRRIYVPQDDIQKALQFGASVL